MLLTLEKRLSLPSSLCPSIMLLSSVSASVAQSIRLQARGHQVHSSAVLSLSLSLSLLCSFPHSLVAVLPIKIRSSVVRLHYRGSVNFTVPQLNSFDLLCFAIRHWLQLNFLGSVMTIHFLFNNNSILQCVYGTLRSNNPQNSRYNRVGRTCRFADWATWDTLQLTSPREKCK